MDEREEMTAEVMYGSKTKQAYELIKQKILMLEYAPGQPLRELELSEQLSMSRTPIRAAIERLVADCFVDEAHRGVRRLGGQLCGAVRDP